MALLRDAAAGIVPGSRLDAEAARWRGRGGPACWG